MFYKLDPAGIGQIHENWDLYNVPKLDLDQIAAKLVSDKILSNDRNDWYAINSLTNQSWRSPIRDSGRPFLDEVCAKLGTPAIFMEDQSLRWSADIVPDSRLQANGVMPAQAFRDRLKVALKDDSLIQKLSITAQKAPSGNKTMGLLPFAALGTATLALIGSDIYTYADSVNTALLITLVDAVGSIVSPYGLVALGIAGLVNIKMSPRNAHAIAALEEASLPLIVNRWIEAAKEQGRWKASVQDKFFDYPDLVPPKRRHWAYARAKRASLRKLQREYNWQFQSIPDIEAAAEDKKAEMVGLLTRKMRSMDDHVRGIVINVTSDNPQLQGTRLRLAALPDNPTESSTDDDHSGLRDMNRKEAKADRGGIGQIRDWVLGKGGWSPQPA